MERSRSLVRGNGSEILVFSHLAPPKNKTKTPFPAKSLTEKNEKRRKHLTAYDNTFFRRKYLLIETPAG